MLLLLNSNVSVDKSIKLLNLPPIWIVVLIIIPTIFLFVFWIYKKENTDISPFKKYFIGTFRLLILLLVLFLIFDPVLTEEQVYKRKSTLILLFPNI